MKNKFNQVRPFGRKQWWSRGHMGVWYCSGESDWTVDWWGYAGNTDTTTIPGSSVGLRMFPSAGRNQLDETLERGQVLR